MEVKVLESSKKKIVLELEGEDATFCHILKEELWNDKAVTAAAFKVEHPLINIPTLLVETDGSKDPKDALKEAVKRVKKLTTEFKKEAAKL